MFPLVRPDRRHDGDKRCFYCHEPVGSPHLKKCVQVQCKVEYEVRVGGRSWDDLSGEMVGTFEDREPYHWTEYDCEFHKNGSSWCAGNAVDRIKWNSTQDAADLRAKIEALTDKECECGLLAFSFHRVTDPGPLDGQAEEARYLAEGKADEPD